jgi:DNA-binding SARP family transcriptional activator
MTHRALSAADGHGSTMPPEPDAPRINLLGAPEVRVGEHVRPAPAGRKTWAVLTYLLLVNEPPTRTRLANLCFANAEDPRAALRWTLTDLRRLLGDAGDPSGDPLRLVMPLTMHVDLWQVLDRAPAAEVACMRGQLLEGMSYPSSEPLDRWLALERHRLALACARILEAATHRAEDTDRPDRAAEFAAGLVALDPYGEPATSRNP